jgi:hypothetical protein
MRSFRDNNEIVYILRRDSHCRRCGCELWKGRFICVTGDTAICLGCAGLAHLEFLPSGDVAVTRRAARYSSRQVVVMKRSPVRKRAERQGILVEPRALRRARIESAADADLRAERRMQAAIRRQQDDEAYLAAFANGIAQQYPLCPEAVTHEITDHACRKYSHRIGRSADAKRLHPTVIRIAVMAHIRHKYTDYDRLLDLYNDRQLARNEVRAKVEEILMSWMASG